MDVDVALKDELEDLLPVGVADEDADAMAEAVTVLEGDAVGLPEADAEPEGVDEPVGVGELEPDDDCEALEELVEVAEMLMVREEEAEEDAEADADAVWVKLTVRVDVAVELKVELEDALREAVADEDRVAMADAVRVLESELELVEDRDDDPLADVV